MQEFDKEVGVSFSSSKRRSRSCICLIILSVAVVLLLTVSAIFVTFYVLDKSTSASQSAENASLSTVYPPGTGAAQSTARPSNTPYLPTTQKSREQKYCGSKACFLTSIGRLPTFMALAKTAPLYIDFLAPSSDIYFFNDGRKNKNFWDGLIYN